MQEKRSSKMECFVKKLNIDKVLPSFNVGVGMSMKINVDTILLLSGYYMKKLNKS